MKRLLAAGADSIYQLGKVFRNSEIGQHHNPEFTMLEWYRVSDDLHSLMQFTEFLVQRVISIGLTLTDGATINLAERVSNPTGFERLTYQQAFVRYAKLDAINADMSDFHELALERNLVPPPGLDRNDRDGWQNFLLAALIEPYLGRDCPVFLLDYPASQAALAQLSVDGQTALRFELYIDGIELCNGYQELTDEGALRRRIQGQAAIRSAAGLRPLPGESRLLAAMEHGLPACSGNALGVDRLVMLALGKIQLSEVISFPFEIA